MPIVTIQALPPSDPKEVDELLAAVCNELAAAIETTPDNVWANFSAMTAVREGDGTAYHPIVTVLANPRPRLVVERGMKAVAKAVASRLSVPLERVWLHWTTLDPRNVFSGK